MGRKATHDRALVIHVDRQGGYNLIAADAVPAGAVATAPRPPTRQLRASAAPAARPAEPDVTAEAKRVLKGRPDRPGEAYPAAWLPGVEQPFNEHTHAAAVRAQAPTSEPPSMNGHRPDAPSDEEAYPAHWIATPSGPATGGAEGFINDPGSTSWN